jgi:hypothetical protein
MPVSRPVAYQLTMTNTQGDLKAAQLLELLHEFDRRRTIQDIAEEVGIGYGTCQRDLTEESGMHRVAAKFVPMILTADQMQQRTLPSLPSSFWRKTKWLSFHTHLTPLIWHPVTSSYFQK